MRASPRLAALAALCGCAQIAPSEAPVAAATSEDAEAACAGKPYRAFDFWIGAWDVYRTNTGERAGSSVIEAVEEGCVVIER
jgi:hypothetical protein